MSKLIKQMEMNDLRRTFDGVRDLAVLSTEKLSAQGEYTFRSALRKKGIRLKVVKNSLARRVFRELNLSVPDDSPYWQKQTMLAWGGTSISGLTRDIDAELTNPKAGTLYKEKDKEKVTRKGAIADGQPLEWKQAREMPTREELLGQIVSMIIGPGGAIAACLDGPGAMLASQLATLAEKEGGEAAPAEAPAAPAAG
jgi:large subunit ribosomal protein L10